MDIQSYQIHNVLNVYRKQLSRKITKRVQAINGQATRLTVAPISSEMKKQTFMDKVTANILKKITNIDLEPSLQPETTKRVTHQENTPDEFQGKSTFSFNTIIGSNQKETRFITVDDSRKWISQLDQWSQTVAGRKSEPAGRTENTEKNGYH